MLKKALRGIFGTLAALALVAVFYIAVVLGHPQENQDAVIVPVDQPVLAASPARTLGSVQELPDMLDAFPVPMLYAVEGTGLTLNAGMSYDAAYGEGFARIAVLKYAAEIGGQPVEISVQSIYPARALELVPRGDYRLSATAGQTLAGVQSVRMEDGEHIRLHVQTAEGLYVLTAPNMTGDELTSVTRALQLYAAEGE